MDVADVLSDRSRWGDLTIATYDAVAENDSGIGRPLYPDDRFFQVRGQMADNPFVLDIGCGDGRLVPLLRFLNIARFIGIDASEKLVQKARIAYPGHEFRVGNILSLKQAVGILKFDGFFSIASLMHILPEDMPCAAASIREVLNMGAAGFITTPMGDEEALLSSADNGKEGGVAPGAIPDGHHMFRALWDPEKLARCFEKAGFSATSSISPSGYMVDLLVRAI